jgi:ABC-type nitrate/sulfonate/bicarbonate transport system ATPase subunit/ABC-type nitrate/sulfonate/bicarbonate transport system permease component
MESRPRNVRRTLIAVLAGVGVILVLWCTLPLAFSEAVVPFPWTVVARLGIFISGGEIWIQMGITLARTAVGFLLALVVGTAAGFLSGRLAFFSRSFFLPVSIIQGAPPLLWIIPLVLILGTGGLAPVGVVFFVVLPIVIISVQEGIKTLDPAVEEMMKVYASSPFALVRDFYIPGLSGHFKSLLISGLLVGLKSSIIGEWFGARSGIGRMINEYFYNFDMPSFYAVALFYVLSVVLVSWLMGRLGKHAFTRRVTTVPAEAGRENTSVQRRAAPARLEFHGVSFSFGRRRVCDHLDFSLGKSMTVILTGDSGVGKTTLARLSLGLLKPKTGRVVLPRRACLLFQEDVFLNHRDCLGNVMLAVPDKTSDYAAGRGLAALEAVGLAEYVHHFPDELSGGMKKRLAFARALAFDPDFIILDEPFNKLHKKARRELWDLHFRLFTGRGVPSLIITHYPEELSDRSRLSFFEMREGKVTAVK